MSLCQKAVSYSHSRPSSREKPLKACLLKALIIKQSQQRATILEVMAQLESGVDAIDVTLNTKIGMLHDRIPSILLNTYNAMNKPERIMKASTFLLLLCITINSLLFRLSNYAGQGISTYLSPA